MSMDKEEQREASAAGFLVGIFILFLLVVGVIALVTLWPAIHVNPPPPTPLPGVRK